MVVRGEAVSGRGEARAEFKVIALVSSGHFFSHFYLLLLPPLFPMLREVYGVGFTELGFAITIQGLIAGITQAPVGFLVDRYGASNILVAGLVLESVAFMLIGAFPAYGALLALMVLAGLGNAVYHPADYAILNAAVHPSRIGRAFSLHTFSGYVGQALAPLTMIFLMRLTDWRTALLVCALVGLAVALLMKLSSGLLVNVDERGAGHASGKGGGGSGLALLFSLPVLMGLLFFAGLSMSSQGISGFSVSALHLIYEAPLTEVGFVLSAYLFGLPAGVLVGGWLADRTRRHDLTVAICISLTAAAILAVAAFELTLPQIALLFAAAGILWGVIAPSRDMLIRSVTPARDTGKVFGFVSVGFNLATMVGPPLFGFLLDSAEPRAVFWAAGILSSLTVATVLFTGKVGRAANR